MQIFYGGFPFPANAARFSPSRQTATNKAGQPYQAQCRCDVTATIFGSTPQQLVANVHAAVAALNKQYQRFEVIMAFGTSDAKTVVCLPNSGSVSGTIVKNVSCPDVQGGWTAFQPVQFTVEASYPLYPGVTNELVGFGTTSAPPVGQNQTSPFIIDWQETLTLSGGAPRLVAHVSASGKPQIECAAKFTPYRLTQQGQATGHLGYPTAPPALFPNSLTGDPSLSQTSPHKQTGNGNAPVYTDYAIAWAYEMLSDKPLVAFPNYWK